jgi:hypothetical protein
MIKKSILFESTHGKLSLFVTPGYDDLQPNSQGNREYAVPNKYMGSKHQTSIRVTEDTPRGVLLLVEGEMNFTKPRWISDFHIAEDLYNRNYRASAVNQCPYYWNSTSSREILLIEKYSQVLKKQMQKEQERIDAILG